MKSNLVDIECKVVSETEKAIAVVDGTEEEVPLGGPLGKSVKRLKRFWLPKSQVEVNGDGTVTMPEPLAIEKGLV